MPFITHASCEAKPWYAWPLICLTECMHRTLIAHVEFWACIGVCQMSLLFIFPLSIFLTKHSFFVAKRNEKYECYVISV